MNHRLPLRMIQIVLVAVLLATSGCASDTNSAADRGTVPDSFALGADREPTARTLYSMARLLAVKNRDAQSEFILRRLLHDYPEYAPAYNDLAELQMRHGRLDEAMETLQTGLTFAKGDAILLNNLGMCRMVLGDYDGALDQFTRASAQSPQDARYRANMAVALCLLDREDEAVSLYAQMMSTEDAERNVQVLREARHRVSPIRQQ